MGVFRTGMWSACFCWGLYIYRVSEWVFSGQPCPVHILNGVSIFIESQNGGFPDRHVECIFLLGSLYSENLRISVFRTAMWNAYF